MAQAIGNDELPNNGAVYRFEGYLYGDVDVSFFLSDTAPGKGPDLHKHPYEEIFVVQEGELTFTVGEDTIEATGGQIVNVPASAAQVRQLRRWTGPARRHPCQPAHDHRLARRPRNRVTKTAVLYGEGS